jgi:hypothetical protein
MDGIIDLQGDQLIEKDIIRTIPRSTAEAQSEETWQAAEKLRFGARARASMGTIA